MNTLIIAVLIIALVVEVTKRKSAQVSVTELEQSVEIHMERVAKLEQRVEIQAEDLEALNDDLFQREEHLLHVQRQLELAKGIINDRNKEIQSTEAFYDNRIIALTKELEMEKDRADGIMTVSDRYIEMFHDLADYVNQSFVQEEAPSKVLDKEYLHESVCGGCVYRRICAFQDECSLSEHTSIDLKTYDSLAKESEELYKEYYQEC